MAKGKGRGVLDLVFGASRMGDDDLFEDEEYDEEDVTEDEEDEDEEGFNDSDERSSKRIPFNISIFSGRSRTSKPRRTYEREDDEQDDDGLDEEYAEEEQPKPKTSTFRRPRATTGSRYQERVTPMKSTRSSSQAFSNEVRVLHPKGMNEAPTIGQALLDECVVVLNLEAMDLEEAQRIVDFTAGCVFALGADFHKVTEYFFLIAPSSVEISDDMKDRFAKGETFAMSAEY